MNDTKPLLLSTTVQGAILVALGMLVKYFGLPIGETELGDIMTAVLEIVGVVMVVIGRLKSNTRISGIIR